jgi:hypothetical protein
VVFVTLTLAMPAVAQDVVCGQKIGAEVVDGILYVEGLCELDGTVVKRGIIVGVDSELRAKNVQVLEGLQGQVAGAVDLVDSDIGGAVQIGSRSGPSAISGSHVGGRLIVDNAKHEVVISANEVDGDVTLHENGDGVFVDANLIGGSLICGRNDPAPQLRNNVVAGASLGQCAVP